MLSPLHHPEHVWFGQEDRRIGHRPFDDHAPQDARPGTCTVLGESEFGMGVACDYQNRAISVGRHVPESSSVALIVVYDAAGQEQWFRTKHIDSPQPYNDRFESVVTDAVGNIYAVGSLWNVDPNVFNQDWMVLKYSPVGDELWLDTRHSWTVDAAHSVRMDPAGDIVVGGHDTIQAGFRGHVVKYSPDKTVQWTHTITGGGVTITDGVAITAAGDYLTLTRATMGTPKLRKLSPAGGVLCVSGRIIPVISSRGRSGVLEAGSRAAWAVRGGGGWRRC